MNLLKSVFLGFVVITIGSTTACINDSEVAEGNATDAVVIEKPIDNAPVESTNDTVFDEPAEDAVVKSDVVEVDNQKKVTKTKVVSHADKKVDISDEQPVEKKEEVVLSESLDLKTKRNVKYNPDNANAPVEIEEKSSITLIPIFSDDDLAKYYVQFKESPSKMSKKDVEALLKNDHKVYVVSHQGLYKYCVGKSDSEAEAKAFKKKFDKLHSKTKTTVVTYKSAW